MKIKDPNEVVIIADSIRHNRILFMYTSLKNQRLTAGSFTATIDDMVKAVGGADNEPIASLMKRYADTEPTLANADYVEAITSAAEAEKRGDYYCNESNELSQEGCLQEKYPWFAAKAFCSLSSMYEGLLPE